MDTSRETQIPQIHIVVAHYHENLDWTKKLKYPYTIVSRAGIPPMVAPNKGNEASSFLEYIIENYENLADITFFVHGHEKADHQQDRSIIDIIDEHVAAGLPEIYKNINGEPLRNLREEFKPSYSMLCCVLPIFKEIFQDARLTTDCFGPCLYRQYAQFYVRREKILSRPRETYWKLYCYLMNTNESSYWTGRYFEYLWHYIFTNELNDV